MEIGEARLEELASGQLGRFNRAQVAGLLAEVAPEASSRELIRSRLRSRRWRRLTSRVLAFPAAPRGELADVWTAHLHIGPDAVVSHSSAAILHRLPGVPPSEPHLTLPNGSNRRYAAGRLHQSRDIGPVDVTTVDGLPATTVARTLVDLAGEFRRPRMEFWVDHCLGERLVSIAELRSTVERLGRPRRRGAALMRSVLEGRLPGPAIEESILERALTTAIRRAGLPDGHPQFPCPGRPGDRSGRVDRAWPEASWVVEADGRRWHARESAAALDGARDRSAAAVGWLVTRFTWSQLTAGADGAVQDMREIYAQRVRAGRT